MEALCSVNVKNFPFDKQICSLVFGSWSYHGFELDFYPREDFGDLSSMRKNVEWDVPKITVEKHVKFYGCCKEPYPDIAFYIHLTRKPSYYITNIILPSLIITVLIVLGFILPVSSGEKVSLEITVMLAISVFQLLVADKLPPSADSTPLIGMMLSVVFVCLFVCLMVFKATFSNNSVISWWSVLLVEEAGGFGENHRPVAIY